MPAENRNGQDIVLDVSKVVELEQAIAASGTSLATLMRRAGTAIARAVEELQPDTGRGIAVLAGSGNNGGDGWVAAEVLAANGYPVMVVSTKEPEAIHAQPAHDAAQTALASEDFKAGKLTYCTADDIQAVDQALEQASVIIDALLGTGFTGAELRPAYAQLIAAANSQRTARGAKVVAADVPSGLSAQTGECSKPCMEADLTVTMMVKKPGLLTPAGAKQCGELRVADIADLTPFL